MKHLVPCPNCSRHVRVRERVCPFCGAPLPSALRAEPPPELPPRRLGSVATVTYRASLETSRSPRRLSSSLGLAATLGLAACAGTSEPAPEPDAGSETDSGNEAGANSPDSGDDVDFEAGTPDSGSGVGGAANQDPPDGGPVPIYKAVPPG
jgi:hypothetical protein